MTNWMCNVGKNMDENVVVFKQYKSSCYKFLKAGDTVCISGDVYIHIQVCMWNEAQEN